MVDVTIMQEKGFIGRDSFRIRFEDLHEVVYASLILNKIENYEEQSLVEVEISLLDLFPRYKSLEELAEVIQGKTGVLKNKNSEYFADMINHMFGTNYNAAETKIDLIDFYNKRIKQCLDYLVKGDSVALKPCIESVDTVTNQSLHSFIVKFIPKKLREIQAKNVYNHFTLSERMFSEMQDKLEETSPYVSYRKQLEFAHNYFKERQDKTGEVSFEFNLKEIPFRHLVTTMENENERFTLPVPF